MHLWDLEIEGRVQVKESEMFSRGNKVGVVETELGRIGMGIGYDLRFPWMAEQMVQQKKAQLLLYPANFNNITGQLHWDLLMKARAVDNECFVAGVNPAKQEDPLKYQSYGRSTVVDPLGRTLSSEMGEDV